MTVITGETGAGKSIAIDAWVCVWAVALRPIWSVPEQPAPICVPAFALKELHTCGIALWKTSLKKGANAYFAALSAAMVAHGLY